MKTKRSYLLLMLMSMLMCLLMSVSVLAKTEGQKIKISKKNFPGYELREQVK